MRGSQRTASERATAPAGEPRTVALLMLVTPPELPIARFTIPALRRLEREGVSVTVFANGLSAGEERTVADWIRGLRHVTLVSNRERIAAAQPAMVPGTTYMTDAGRMELRVGRYESAPEIWERELVRLDADLVGIMDSDFEVLSGEFLTQMVAAFAADPGLGFMSVDFSPTAPILDSYSAQHCILWERHHTWFCLYRPAALRHCSDFSYHEEYADGMLVKFDHSARLQQRLKREYGYRAAVLARRWGGAFLHYGAFAQNRSLEGWRLRLYRFIRIGRHDGWRHVHGSRTFAALLRVGFMAAYRLLGLRRYDVERLTYRFAA